MKPILPLATVFCLASAPGFAGSWKGALVDAKCYDAEERNVSPTDTLLWINRDRGAEVHYCVPKKKTMAFEIVDSDGYVYQFDSAGDTQAAQLVQTAGKRSLYAVTVTGDLNKKTIAVQTILLTGGAPHN